MNHENGNIIPRQRPYQNPTCSALAVCVNFTVSAHPVRDTLENVMLADKISSRVSRKTRTFSTLPALPLTLIHYMIQLI